MMIRVRLVAHSDRRRRWSEGDDVCTQFSVAAWDYLPILGETQVGFRFDVPSNGGRYWDSIVR